MTIVELLELAISANCKTKLQSVDYRGPFCSVIHRPSVQSDLRRLLAMAKQESVRPTCATCGNRAHYCVNQSYCSNIHTTDDYPVIVKDSDYCSWHTDLENDGPDNAYP